MCEQFNFYAAEAMGQVLLIGPLVLFWYICTTIQVSIPVF